MKKGQGLSLSTIVIASLALVVLIILVGITTGYFGKWTSKFKDIGSTECKGTITTAEACGQGYTPDYAVQLKPGEICCIRTSTASSSYCGNFRCEQGETNIDCPNDC